MPNHHQKQQGSSGQHQKKKKKKFKKKQHLTLEMERESTLRHLQDMFKDVLDPVLTHTILEEHNFVVDSALETLFPLAEEAGKSFDRAVPSFKDIKDRLSRPYCDDDSEDEDGNDNSESDELTRVEEEDPSNQYQCHNLDLPLLPKSFLSSENADVNGMPFSPAGSTGHGNSGHTTASSEIDKLLASHRESYLHHDVYGNPQSQGEEIPPHFNVYNGAAERWPHRNDANGTMHMGNYGPLYEGSYYHPPGGRDAAHTQSSQDYLNTYYRDPLQFQSRTNVRSQNSLGGIYSGDPKPWMPQRRVPHDNTHGGNLPNYQLTKQTGVNTAHAPAWPKTRSTVIRTHHPPKQRNSENAVEPLPPGKVLCLMRGLPGSGKSTLARNLLRAGSGGQIISTDDFFIQRDGTYKFNPYYLDEAHRSAQSKAKRAMEKGQTPVIIDNTNTQLWEMKPYVQLAVKCNYHVEVREPSTPWREKVGELARRNQHGVPSEKIGRMRERYEKLDSVDDILNAPDKHTFTKGKKDSELPLERDQFESKHSNDRKTNRDGADPARKITKQPQDVQISERDSGASNAQHDVEPLFSKDVEERQFSEQQNLQGADLRVKEREKQDSKEVIPSGTDSNLSEIQDVITSIPIASCLKENVSSFQSKLSELNNLDDLYKSSGSDDIMPKRVRTSADERAGVRNGEQQETANVSEDDLTKVNQDAKQINETAKGTVDEAIRGVDQNLDTKNLENSEGSSVDPFPLASRRRLSKEPRSGNEEVKDISYENAKKREKDQSGMPELAKYLTPSEQDDEYIRLSEGKGKLTQSEGGSLTENTESWSRPSKMSDASKASDGNCLTTPQISTHVGIPSHPSSTEQIGASRMEVCPMEPRVVSGSVGVEDMDKRDTSTEPTGKRDKNEVDVPRCATPVEDINQKLASGSEWELTGAKPKFKRAVSQPVALISSEYHSPKPSSPIGESHFQFHSLATVPQAKKRQRRAATPFGRRCLAPTFSVPSLPSLGESLGNLSAISPIGKDYSEHDSKIKMENVTSVTESKLSIAHPSSESDEVNTSTVQVVSEHEPSGERKSVNSEHPLQTREQPIKRKVARPSKPPSTPFLSEETRQKAMSQNWSSGAITKEVVSPQKLLVQERASHSRAEMKHQSSQTDPSHFKFLEKANSTSDTDSPMPGLLWIKEVSPRVWNIDDSRSVFTEREETIPHRRKIDQSSMTEISVEGDFETNVVMLHSVFSHLEKEQVKGVLKDCHGNIEWASEVLLELKDGITQSTGKGKKKKRKGKKNANGLQSEPQNEIHLTEKSSQTSKADFLVLKVINDGTQVIEQVPHVDVIVSKEWISMSNAAASENSGKSNHNGRFTEAGTMAEFEEEFPKFDEHLSKLLQSHMDVPYVEVCELLERNRGDYAQTERALHEMSKNKEQKAQASQSADLKVSEVDEASNKKDAVNKRNRPKNVGSQTSNAGADGTKRVDKKPRVVSKLTSADLLKEEDATSFSDQEASNYQRGRPSSSDLVPSQGRQHRRSRSVPRNGSQTLQVQEEKKKETRDVKQKQKAGTKTGQQKSQKQQNVVTSDKHKYKDANSNDEERKQPKRAGLGKHLTTRDEEMSLPNKYSFQELRKQKAEDIEGICDGQSPELEQNRQEVDVKKNGCAEAASTSIGRATPSDLLDEEGKGVPARFHKGMTFQLDMAFALQLQEIFGSVGYNIDTDVLSDDDLTISVNLELAKTIHSAWSQSFQVKFEREEKQLLEMMKQDEALAKQLQQEEERKEMEAKQKMKEKKRLGSIPQHLTGSNSAVVRFPPSQGAEAGVKTENFRDIMAVEMAEELGRQMQKEEALSSGAGRSMAVNLRKQELSEKYPGVDKSWLENIFMTFNYDFESTIMYIDDLIKEAGQPRNVYPDGAAQMVREMKEQQVTTEQNEGFQLVQNRRSPKTERRPPPTQPHNEADDDDDDDLKKPDKFQSMNHPDYHDYRAEANQHYQQRKECFTKASEAFRKGQMEQAAYYSQQGHKHTALLQEANERASEAILVARNREQDNNTIDLHGLHADEAVLVLERTIQERLNRIKYSSQYMRPPTQLYIITGRGIHSKGGVARVKPAVQRYLTSIGFRWTHMNDGMLRINLA